MKKVLAIRHVEIEHLGIFEPLLKSLGFSYEYLDTPRGMRLNEPLENYRGVIVLGGYMGAYEEKKYPFLGYEFHLMEEALKQGIPLLGICLGAQMLAKILGARVYKGEKGKEIGWLEVFKTGEHSYFSDFPERFKVFQWHGDTFDLPVGAQRLFSSEKYENQGFVFERSVGLQFHIEVDKGLARVWKEAYQEEIEKEGLEERVFEEISEEEESLLKELSRGFLKKFLLGE